MSSMDLDSSLDDLIKQRKTHPKKGSSQPNKAKKLQKGKEKGNLSIQTKAKVKKPASNNNVKTNKSIMSRLVKRYYNLYLFNINPLLIVIDIET